MVHYYWNRLTDGGERIAVRLYDLVSHLDPACAAAATEAMYGMRKIVLADLESAAAPV